MLSDTESQKTRFMQLVFFDSPWKHKNKGFLLFSESMKPLVWYGFKEVLLQQVHNS